MGHSLFKRKYFPFESQRKSRVLRLFAGLGVVDEGDFFLA